MGRLSAFLAIMILMGSAVYAYSVKYETIVLAEQIAKHKLKISREKESIALLQAEWQFLNRPDRIQALVEQHSDLQALQIQQIVRWADVPVRKDSDDKIGQKLDMLGLSDVTSSLATHKKPATQHLRRQKVEP
jgi:hypothetical protein